jgi:hypothetical protein
MKRIMFGLLLLCLAAPACAKHKSDASAESRRMQEAAGEEARQDAERLAEQAERDAEEEFERVELPPPDDRGETASTDPAQGLPGEDTAPGTTRAVRPAQGSEPGMEQPGAAATQGQGGSGQPQAEPSQPELSTEQLEAIEQGTNERDRRMTQRIRQALIKDDALSFTAKNVQIVTRDGNVILRGLVMHDKERKSIEETARGYAGGGKVYNLLQLKSTPSTMPTPRVQ